MLRLVDFSHSFTPALEKAKLYEVFDTSFLLSVSLAFLKVYTKGMKTLQTVLSLLYESKKREHLL